MGRGRHLPSKCWDQDLSISLGMPVPIEGMLRKLGVALPSLPVPFQVPQLHFYLPGGQASCRVYGLSCAVTLSWMPSSLYTQDHAHTSTLSRSPRERRQESPVVQTDSTASHQLDSPLTAARLGQTCLSPSASQTWYRVNAL